MALKYVLLVAALVGIVIAQTKRFPSSPPYHQPKVYEKNMTEEEFKEMCAENGGPDAFNNVEKADKEYKSYFLRSDVTAEEYCSIDVVQKLIEAYIPCFSEMERKNLKTFHGLAGKFHDLRCFEDNIVSPSMIMCPEPQLDQVLDLVSDCFNKPDSPETFDDGYFRRFVAPLSRIEYWEEECEELSQLHGCLGAAVEDCQAPLRNKVDEFFEVVRKDTPCGGQVANSRPNSVIVLVPSLMLAAFATLLV